MIVSPVTQKRRAAPREKREAIRRRFVASIKNVLKTPSIRINARGAEAEFNIVPITDSKQVSSIIEKFRAKYGANDCQRIGVATCGVGHGSL